MLASRLCGKFRIGHCQPIGAAYWTHHGRSQLRPWWVSTQRAQNNKRASEPVAKIRYIRLVTR